MAYLIPLGPSVDRCAAFKPDDLALAVFPPNARVHLLKVNRGPSVNHQLIEGAIRLRTHLAPGGVLFLVYAYRLSASHRAPMIQD
jgi:hypothetical protein